MDLIEGLLAQIAIAQAELPVSPAAPWVEYAVYGGVGLIILLIVLSALRSKPKTEGPPKPDEEQAARVAQAQAISDEQIEAEARKAFKVPEVSVDESGQMRVVERRVELAPTGVARPEPEPEAPPPRAAPTPKVQPKPEPKAAPKATPKPEPKATPRQVAKAPAPPPKAATPPPEPVAPVEEAAGKTLREGLARTHDGFVSKLGKLFGNAKVIDDDLLGELEEALFTADIGVRTSQRLVDMVHEAMSSKALKDPNKVWERLRKEVGDILQVEAPPLDLDRAKPLVIMMVGVNGAGKTTSIGKLARRYTDAGKKVMLAAGDTFRAAAVEQLQAWGERADVPVVFGADGQDPSSVIFDACKRAQDEGFDILLADTAGRLQARKELMDELAKVHRVIGKACPGAPHEVWLVLDATNGQNAISQAKQFTEVVNVTGIVLTKLDGTAKGGVVIGISDEMGLPVRYIGIGEKAEDLRAFDATEFTEALFGEA